MSAAKDQILVFKLASQENVHAEFIPFRNPYNVRIGHDDVIIRWVSASAVRARARTLEVRPPAGRVWPHESFASMASRTKASFVHPCQAEISEAEFSSLFNFGQHEQVVLIEQFSRDPGPRCIIQPRDPPSNWHCFCKLE